MDTEKRVRSINAGGICTLKTVEHWLRCRYQPHSDWIPAQIMCDQVRNVPYILQKRLLGWLSGCQFVIKVVSFIFFSLETIYEHLEEDNGESCVLVSCLTSKIMVNYFWINFSNCDCTSAKIISLSIYWKNIKKHSKNPFGSLFNG